MNTRSARVLIACSDPDARRSAERALSQRYVLEIAPAAASFSERRGHPDLIVAGSDGITGACVLLREARMEHDLAAVPIVLVLSADSDDSRERALAGGADDCVVAPFSEMELRARVASNLQLAALRRRVDGAMCAERVLRESELLYRTLLENVRDYAAFMLTPGGIISEWPASAQRLTGYTAADATARHVSMLFPHRAITLGEVRDTLVQASACGQTEREGWRIRKSGTPIWVNEIVSAVRDEDNRLVGFTSVIRDLTERHAAEKIVERERRRLERGVLHKKMLEAEEDERRRLSRELHDEAGQHLTALTLGLDALSATLIPGSHAGRQAAAVRMLAERLAEDLHAIAVRLRPKALDDFGLEAAVVSYADDWSTRCGIAVDVHAQPAAGRLSPVVETCIYRIVQEALTNVARHSKAAHVAIVIERRDACISAIVEDDGTGFDPAQALLHNGTGNGIGVSGMRERAEMLGGTLDVESAVGAGTTLFARVPLQPAGVP